jgi:serpin B
MLYAGAAGGSEKEMREVMGFNKDTHLYMHKLKNILETDHFQLFREQSIENRAFQLPPEERTKERIDEIARSFDDQNLIQDGETIADPIVFAVANAIWPSSDMPIKSSFLNTLKKYYSSDITELDFVNHPSEAIETINAWIADKTNQKIQNLIPKDALSFGSKNEKAFLILTNALSFSSKWHIKLDETEGMFYFENGRSVKKTFLKTTGEIGYYAGNGYKVIKLPYQHHQHSFMVIFPDMPEGFKQIEEDLNYERINNILDGMNPTLVNLRFPQFSVKKDHIHQSGALKKLGMPSLFMHYKNNFSGVSNRSIIALREVYHGANIDVDKEGTGAFSGTAFISTLISGWSEQISPMPIDVNIDRPFLYLILQTRTNAILFLGRYTGL